MRARRAPDGRHTHIHTRSRTHSTKQVSPMRRQHNPSVAHVSHGLHSTDTQHESASSRTVFGMETCFVCIESHQRQRHRVEMCARALGQFEYPKCTHIRHTHTIVDGLEQVCRRRAKPSLGGGTKCACMHTTYRRFGSDLRVNKKIDLKSRERS